MAYYLHADRRTTTTRQASARTTLPRMLMVVARLDGRRITRLEGQWAGRAPSPVRNEFLDLVNDLWYHAIWTAKKKWYGEM